MTSSPQTSLLRREYGMDWRKRWVFLILGAIFVLLWFIPLSHHHNIYDDYGRLGEFVGLFLYANGISFIVRAIPSKLVIQGSRIEVRNFLRLRTATYDEIEGYYRDDSGSSARIYLRLKDQRGKIAIPRSFNLDDDFHAWLEHLPNLNSKNRDERITGVTTDLTLGITAEKRLEELHDAKQVSGYFFAAMITAAAGLHWGSWMVKSVSGLLLAVAPIFVYWLLVRFPQLYGFRNLDGDPRPDLFWRLWPVSVLFGTATYLADFVSIQSRFWVAGSLALVFTWAFYRFLPKNASKNWRIWNPIWLFLFMAMPYSFGFTVLANTLPDRTAGETYVLPVTETAMTHDSGRYEIEVPPSGPFGKLTRVRVNADTYAHVQSTKQIIIRLHPGFLRLPWYEVLS